MTLTVRLPETIESQLTRFCEVMGMSKSQVVQTALKDWFAKPAMTNAHPLLAFAQAASKAAPSANWAGPYSKERLRERVLASGRPQIASEPRTAYVVSKGKGTVQASVPSKDIKKDSSLAIKNKGLKAKGHKEKLSAHQIKKTS